MSTLFLGIASGIAGLSIGLTIAATLLAVQECRIRAIRRRLAAAYQQLRWARYDASHDPLTGLANRRGCFTRLQQFLDEGGPVSVAVIDLDGFKAFNDIVDHFFGDHYLNEVAASLTTLPVDTVVRLGGDEFALLIRGGHETAYTTAELARRVVARTVNAPGHEVPLRLTATVGIALARPGDRPRDVVRRADQANRHAKQNNLGIHPTVQTSPN